ncbi:GNAT family N-acetyltransferase [Rugamonas apoptosis]|uniref:GNAT family N-acetyltransferase n=1 Tax=Rugamonas apoptosis TaxID=2758570 RepID=A0A7W2FE41_9BURK|nr:GNAT family N-acetyltransferase [Rugamonas apoptosis]MBA5690028.1 GNAT family N-acetyltransferase [Rugamonas apoptosis]
MNISFRKYAQNDKLAVDQVVRDAWIELASVTPGWDQLAPRLGALTENASYTEIVVAELDGEIVGAVGYVGPHRPKPDFFAPEWPMVRFMSVVPKARGHGVGQALLNECIRRAERDNTELIALHTTPVMEAAQYLYRRAGFEVIRHLPDMYGVPYVLMTKELRRD